MFRPLLLSLVVGDFIHVVSGAAVAPTTTAEDSEPTLVRRDGEIPTITMGDIGQYANYEGRILAVASGDDKVEKRSVAIFPTGIIDDVPADGIHVVFGPDMQSDMDKVLNDKCKDPKSMDDCQKELSKLLQESSLNLHAKRFVLITAFTVAEIFSALVAAAVGAIAGAGIGTGVNALKAPGSVNFADTGNDGALAQLNDYTDASAIAIATGADNSIMATISVITAAPTPTHAPDEAVQIEEVTQDNGDDKKGDILIKVPEDTANRLLDYLGMWGLDEVKEICKASQRRRRDRSNLNPRAPPTLNVRCQRSLAQLAGATLTATNDVLMQLVPANLNNPFNPANHAEGAAIPNVNIGEIPMVTFLVREWFGDQDPEANVINEFLMRAAIVTEIVLSAALDAAVVTNHLLTIKMAQDLISKVQPKDILSCPRDLVCVDDNCKGTIEVQPTIPLFQEKGTWQTGFCTEKENNGCICEEVEDPYIYEVEGDDYFSALQQWIKDLQGPDLEASCDSNNKINVDLKKFKDSVNSACNNHDELKRLKKRGIVSWDWDNIDSEHFQWSFDWNDQSEQCDMKCEDVFEIFEGDDKCVWNNGMSKSGFVKTECGIASYSVDNPNPATCWDYEFGAPRGKAEVNYEGGVGISVEDALEQFCNDIDGQKLLADMDDSKNSHARRFAYSEWGVRDRRSFWLRAQYAPRDGCQNYEWPHKTNCKAALKQGMDQCAPNQARTNGFLIPGIGCIDYSIHVTDDVHDENPPWKNPVPMWPASYSAPTKNGGYNKPKCSHGQPTRALSDDDLNKAIDAFCTDGGEIKGFGKSSENMFDYPPAGQTQFYPQDSLWYHLTMGAATVNQGDPEPYRDMDWCKNYDFKLGKDDCTFALRKLHHDCKNGKGELRGGDFTYRCVHYKSWGINMQNCDKSPC